MHTVGKERVGQIEILMTYIHYHRKTDVEETAAETQGAQPGAL